MVGEMDSGSCGHFHLVALVSTEHLQESPAIAQEEAHVPHPRLGSPAEDHYTASGWAGGA